MQQFNTTLTQDHSDLFELWDVVNPQRAKTLKQIYQHHLKILYSEVMTLSKHSCHQPMSKTDLLGWGRTKGLSTLYPSLETATNCLISHCYPRRKSCCQETEKLLQNLIEQKRLADEQESAEYLTNQWKKVIERERLKSVWFLWQHAHSPFLQKLKNGCIVKGAEIANFRCTQMLPCSFEYNLSKADEKNSYGDMRHATEPEDKLLLYTGWLSLSFFITKVRWNVKQLYTNCQELFSFRKEFQSAVDILPLELEFIICHYVKDFLSSDGIEQVD